MNLLRLRRGATAPLPSVRAPLRYLCEICEIQPRSLVCLNSRGEVVKSCSDCGPQLGWKVLEPDFTGRRVW